MPKILRVALPIPVRESFDYLMPEGYADDNPTYPGVRVVVPFGRHTKIGYLVQIRDFSDVPLSRLKRAISIIDKKSLLSPVDLMFLVWASRYYHHPLGEVINSAFPVLLRNGKRAVLKGEKFLLGAGKGTEALENLSRRARRQSELLELVSKVDSGVSERTLNKLDWNWRIAASQLARKGLIEIKEIPLIPKTNSIANPVTPTLNQHQKIAIDSVRNQIGRFSTFLLDGVTGSGKTEVYLQLIACVVAQKKQVMVLLPEISLTPQVETRFKERLSHSIAVFHSSLSPSQRLQAWHCFRKGLAPILLGTRSAVFTPMKNPGLIILDEEHDASFKQQEGFRYSARDIAIARAKMLRIPILLGSATPSFESLFNAKKGRYKELRLPKRAGTAMPPRIHILDIRNQRLTEGLSRQMVAEIRTTLARNHQILLFLNRRGFAPTLTCHACGWVAACNRCDTRLVVHVGEKRLRCHHCGREKKLVARCPKCRQENLQPLGLGTERIENVLIKIFPRAKLARIDRDTTRRAGSLEASLKQITEGDVDILLGTQMLAKGHHFPRVTLVGILDVDSGLFSIDFRAPERMAQLIVQVAGRAGREQKPGKVLLQTRHPHQPLLFALIHEGYRCFAKNALKERQDARLPPFSYQALIRAEATVKQKPLRFLEKVKSIAMGSQDADTDCFGPISAPRPKKAGCYRFQLLLQSSKRDRLHRLLDEILPPISILKESRRVRWSLDIDPVDLY